MSEEKTTPTIIPVAAGTSDAPATNNLRIKAKTLIRDVLFIISEGAAIPVPHAKSKSRVKVSEHQPKMSQAYDQLIEKNQVLASKAESLVSAKLSLNENGGVEQVVSAQQEMRTAVAEITKGIVINADDDQAPFRVEERTELIEAYSFAEKKLVYIAAKNIDELRTRAKTGDNVYYLNEFVTTETSQGQTTTTKTTHTKKESISLSDALKTFRRSATEEEAKGDLDPEKVRQAWGEVKKKMAMDWEIAKIKKEGQIKSKDIANFVDPTIAAFFDDSDYEAIDNFIEKVNNAAKVQWNKYAEKREELVKKITDEKKPISPDDWEKIKREVKDIWWPEWRDATPGQPPQDDFGRFAFSFSGIDFPSTERNKNSLAERLAKQPLPPVMWDASAGAQFMRYSAGASAKAEFDVLETGKLAVQASAEAGFNLLEAKADAGFYLPNSNGLGLEFELPIRKANGHWSELTRDDGSPMRLIAPGPHFAFDKSIVSPKGIYELTQAVVPWAHAAQAAQKNNLQKYGDTPLKVQVAGHTDAVGNDLYNMRLSQRRAQAAYGLMANDADAWLQLFMNADNAWGDYEVRLMAMTVLCIYRWNLNLDLKNIETEQDIIDDIRSQQGPNKTNTPSEPTLGLDGKQNVPISMPTIDTLDALQTLESISTQDLIRLFQAENAKGLPFGIPILGLQKLDVDGDYSINSQNGSRTLGLLISSYLSLTGNRIKQAVPNAIFFDQIHFYSDQTIGLGENKLWEDTQDRSRKNRRIELIPWGITDETKKMERAPYHFGDVRIHISGHVKGEAGANINLGANINFEVDKNALLVAGVIGGAVGQDVKLTGGQSRELEQQNVSTYEKTTTKGDASGKVYGSLADFNAEAGAKASAFAGAKAEAGLKGAIDWRPPNDYHAKHTQNTTPEAQINKFLTLGDVGYTVTGMAGIGLDADFKIGFDQESRRFQIKVSAKAAVGLGGGGGFSFSIAINYIFDFIQLVHTKLSDNNFHFIDVFEGINDKSGVDVYSLFSAFSYELLKRGHVLKAGMVYAAGGALGGALGLLQDYDKVLAQWEAETIESDNLSTLIETIKSKPAQLAYCTPETKGRLLFRLYNAKVLRQGDSWLGQRKNQIKRLFIEPGQRWNEIINLDRYHDIEEAALIVIEQGVVSGRDWQKTLESMLEIDKNGQMDVCIESAPCVDDKISRALKNEKLVRNVLLGDKDDLKRLDAHINTLKPQVTPTPP